MMATGIMAVVPRDFEVAAAALAHTRTSSVDEVYDRSGSQAAHRIWIRLLHQMRAALRQKHRETDDE
jgi:hypothetical protein